MEDYKGHGYLFTCFIFPLFRSIRTREYKEIVEPRNGAHKKHNLTTAGFGFGIR